MKLPPILLLVIIVFTFPIWIGIAGGLFGLVFGLIGGLFGLIGGAIGIVASVFAGIFGWGWHDHYWGDDWGHWGHHHNGFWIVIIVIAVAMALRSRSRRSKY